MPGPHVDPASDGPAGLGFAFRLGPVAAAVQPRIRGSARCKSLSVCPPWKAPFPGLLPWSQRFRSHRTGIPIDPRQCSAGPRLPLLCPVVLRARFYLREFRGRTLAVALPAEEGEAFARIRPVLDDLRGGGSRVLLLSPDAAALEEHARGARSRAAAPLGGGGVAASSRPASAGDRRSERGALCRRLSRARRQTGRLQAGLDRRRGGLRAATGSRHSFLHLAELHSLLEGGGWSGEHGSRRALEGGVVHARGGPAGREHLLRGGAC